MYSFPYLEPVCCSMSSSNYCFLICIQVSQEAGQVVWYSHLFQNFPQFVVIHTVKGFGIVNKAETVYIYVCVYIYIYIFLEIMMSQSVITCVINIRNIDAFLSFWIDFDWIWTESDWVLYLYMYTYVFTMAFPTSFSLLLMSSPYLTV